MGFWKNKVKDQFLDVIEWREQTDDIIFYLWNHQEIKKNSRLIVRPGQDAIFLHNGKVEAIFKEEGNYEMETDIIPVLSTLKGFKFGFDSGLRAEVLFVNTKEFLIKWGTKKPINIPAPGMPGGMPIRCFGTYAIQATDYMTLIDKVAGIKQKFTVEDVKERTLAILDQYIMRGIVREGKDFFNLQMNAVEISEMVQEDLGKELSKFGLSVTEFTISSFNYPEEIQEMINKNAKYGMVGDMAKYQQIGVIDTMTENPESGFGAMAQGGMAMAQTGMGLGVGMQMMNQMAGTFNNIQQPNMQQGQTSQQPVQAQPQPQATAVVTPNVETSSEVCSNCSTNLPEGAKFCLNCGTKVVEKPANKFCTNCGAKMAPEAKFCSDCGNKI